MTLLKHGSSAAELSTHQNLARKYNFAGYTLFSLHLLPLAPSWARWLDLVDLVRN
jgi:hypothetical protein